MAKSWKIRGEISLVDAIEGLLPHQKQFIYAPNLAAAMVGGQGSGKSVALCIAAIGNALYDPNGFSLIGRLNYPALESSTMKSFLELIPEDYGDWRPTPKEFHYRNGHVTIFKHLDISDPKVAGHIKSMNLSAAYIDEATEISEETYLLLTGRVRRKTAPKHLIRLASNPAGQDWVWRYFFDPQRPLAFRANLGINMSTDSNYHLPREIVDNWRATYPPDWAARYLNGEFADFSDLVFKEFAHRTHVWNPLQRYEVFGGLGEPPHEWPVIIGADIGGGAEGDPWAIALISVAPDGRLYQFGEVYGSDLRIAPIAQQIHDWLAGRPIEGFAYDYAQRAAAQELEEYNLGGIPAIKEVQPGIFKMAQYIHVDSRLVHPFSGEKGSPRFFVSSACSNTLREMGGYKYAKDRSGNPKIGPGGSVVPAHDNSHSPSAIRYAIHTFRPLPQKPHEPALWENADLTLQSKLYWQDVAREGEQPVIPKNVQWRRPAGGLFRRAVQVNSRQRRFL
jgi:phage terminase large subunit